MLKNLCNNFFKFVKAKVKKFHIFASLVLLLATFSGSLTAFAQSLFTVKVIIDDGKEYEFKTSKKTVSNFLIYEGIGFEEGDKINVNLDDTINKNMVIKINRANIVKVAIDDKFQVYRVQDMKVSEFFKQEGIIIGEKDILDTSVDKLIDKDMTIYINRAEKVNFLIDNKEKVEFYINDARVGVALKEFCEETGRKVYLEEGQSSAADVLDGMTIKVTSFKEEVKNMQEEIPFEIETIENADLLEGTTNVKIKGQNGIKETTIKEIYKQDELYSKEIIEEKIIKEPIKQIVEKGIKKQPKLNTIKTEKGTFVIDEKINMKSTAYTAGAESTGKNPGDKGYGVTASGMKAQRGVVAVDTKIIPFGTELYIEGYGYAIAGDTGSAIKGNKIDVFFDDYSDAIKYGVKNVNVYVLGEKVS